MDKTKHDAFAFDLENRLDDFFNDDEPPPKAPSTESHPEDRATAERTPSQAPKNPFQDLKSAILSIDWEITDEGLTTLIEHVDKLEKQFSSDKIIHPLLAILKSLGIYIRKRKSNAHPEAIKRLMAAYSCLESITGNSELKTKEKEQMLRMEIVLFKKFKEKITPKKAAPAAHPTKAAKNDAAVTLGAIMTAIEALRSRMEAELSAIRKELKALHNK